MQNAISHYEIERENSAIKVFYFTNTQAGFWVCLGFSLA
jgi:hypothetical protein